MTALLAQSDHWVPTAREFFLFSPELAIVGTLCLLMIAPLMVGRNPRTVATLALVGLAVTAWFTYLVSKEVASAGQSGLNPDPAGGMLIADNLSIFFKFILIIFLAGVIALWWACSADTERDAPEFFVLLLGSAMGMALMVSTQNLLMMMVAIEFASLPSYAMVGFDKRNRLSAEASLKYVIFGGVSAAVMLYGISLTYGYCGTLNVGGTHGIAAIVAERLASGSIHDKLILGFGLFCVFAGIAFKISAVPFHFWCPDAFQGAKTEVTTWLSVASKAAGLLLLLRLVYVFGDAAGTATPSATPLAPLAYILAVIATLTCTVGNLGAYLQTSVKRLLAYSSIAHAGYMLMAATIFIGPGADRSFGPVSALLAYIVIYLFMNLGAFGVTALVASRCNGDDSLSSFNGLMRRAPVLAIPMLFCLISLVGLPPLAGFMAKWWLLYALGSAGSWLHWSLIVVAVVNTLISLWYYMRIVVVMMLKDDGQPAIEVPALGSILVNVCGIVLFALLILNQPVKSRADKYAKHLFSAPQPTGVAVADSSATNP